MSRARTQNYNHRQTAAAPEDPLSGTQGSGCLSGFMIPPIAVLLVSFFLAAFAMRQPIPARAQAQAQIAIPTPTTLAAETIPAIPNETQADAPPEPTPFYALTPTLAPVMVEIVPSSAPALLNFSPSTQLSSIFTPEVQYWKDSIIRWSAAAGVDPNLAAVVMQIESCGDPRAQSYAGAAGLFQVMPFHFYALENPFDPDTNALRGLNYLARSLEAGAGNARLALAGYNGGIGVIARGEWTWSDQTKRYVYYGAPIYEDARAGLSTSAMVNEWYTKYGASLCNQAHERLGLP
jgi:soluble lytic murein transglycosylase-like protein